MTKTVIAVLAAVAFGMTAAPANANPLHSTDGTVAPVTACARIVAAADGEVGNCAVHVCKPRHGHHRGGQHAESTHRRHQKYGCVALALQSDK
jgi:hypothetical protein